MNIKELVELKDKTIEERDRCSDIRRFWLAKLHEHEKDPEKYKMYMDLLFALEPYSCYLKGKVREINRQICTVEGVESIADTDYVREANINTFN